MIEIDGNYGEGGGQIVRTALALSSITGKPFRAFDIRKGRGVPGLKAQHLHAVNALSELCSATSEGNVLASEVLTFNPGQISGKNVNIDIGTAGSISLLLQALLMPCCFAPDKVKLTIRGGTEGLWAMPWDFFTDAYLPVIRPFFGSIDVELEKRGYFPKGGGKVVINISPKYKISDFPDFDSFRNHMLASGPKIEIVERGTLKGVSGISHASTALEKSEVAERQASAARGALASLNCPIKIERKYFDTFSPGSGVFLRAEFEHSSMGADALGERGKRAEIVGKEAADNLLEEISSGAAVDSHLADSLVPWLLFGGSIKVAKMTDHVLTNIWAVEQFFGKTFEINGNVISCVKSKSG